MKNNNIQFALIGAGRMGQRWVKVFSNNKSFKLKAIVDNGSGRASSLASQVPDCIGTNNLSAILKNNDIDAVIIATPHKHLSSISRQALLAGKHVLCEKPGAINAIDIRMNTTIAKRKKLIYMIGYNHRFHDGFLKARKYYDKGTIGDIVFIRARYGFGGRVGYDQEWRLNKTESGGGHLIDMGVHMIDLALSYVGKANNTQGFISDTFWKRGSEDNGFVLLQNKDKVTASIHTSLTQWKALHNFEIYGTKGYLCVEGLGMKYGNGEKLVIGKRSNDFAKVKERVLKCNSNADDSLSLELKEFISAIKQGRETSPSPQDAYETLKIVEQIYQNNKL